MDTWGKFKTVVRVFVFLIKVLVRVGNQQTREVIGITPPTSHHKGTRSTGIEKKLYLVKQLTLG